MRTSFYDEISKNKLKSALLLFFFVVIVIFLGLLFGYALGLGILAPILAFIIAIVSTVFSYYNSDKIILAESHARPVSKEEFPYLYNTVEGLAIAAGIPTPKCYVIDDTAPNAFATGRDPKHAVIVVTTGLLQKMNRQELEGVLAHEMSHIKNYDIRFMMLVAVLVGIIVLLSDWSLRWALNSLYHRAMDIRAGNVGYRGRKKACSILLLLVAVVFAILTPLFATLIKLAISRKREYLADASAVELTRYPEGLASALEKIAKDKEPLEAANKATAHLYIVNPFKNKRFFANLFSTHPPIEERVRILRSM